MSQPGTVQQCIRGCSATDGILLGLIVIDEGYGPRLCGQQCAEFGERDYRRRPFLHPDCDLLMALQG